MEKSPKIAVSRMGALFHYAIPRAIHRMGWLGHFHTDVWSAKPWWRIFNGIPADMRPKSIKRLLGRSSSDLPNALVADYPILTLRNMLQYRRARTLSATLRGHIDAGNRFCSSIIRHGLGDCNAVYTTNTQGLDLLAHAKSRGLKTFMEQTIAPYSIEVELLREERQAFPGWEASLEDGGETALEYAEIERREWAKSDVIFCGSEFVRESVRQAGGPAERCAVMPYCYESASAPEPRLPHHRRLRVLTVGTVCLRKGVGSIARVADRLGKHIDFRIVGPLRLKPAGIAALGGHAELLGQVPRSEVLDHFRWADVFLLPSLCEGSATVCYEALAMGLPVICTPNTGSTVRDGIDGFIVRTGDVDAICERLLQLDGDRMLLSQMSGAAAAQAAGAGLSQYAKRLGAVLEAAFMA